MMRLKNVLMFAVCFSSSNEGGGGKVAKDAPVDSCVVAVERKATVEGAG